MITTVIIDNESQSRKLLRKMLVDSCDEVIVIGEAKDVKSGIELLQRVKPDIVFLDIEMPDGDGFDILNAFNNVRLNTIVVTGYDHYAFKAIKYAAQDYLLKPVDLRELQIAINKIKKSRVEERNRLGMLDVNYKNRTEPLRKIVLPGRENHVVVELERIIRIEANGSYVMIYIEGHKSHLVVNSLSYYEELLPANNFFRIHKSHLINVHKIERFAPGRIGKVFLKDGSELDIAARRKTAFSQLIKQLGNV